MMHLARPTEFVDATHVRRGRRTLVYFAGCDYLRMSFHPAVRAAVSEGCRRHGLNVSASRRTTGNHALFHRLEAALARYFSVRVAVLVPTGYQAPVVAVQSLAGEITHLLADANAHACLLDAAAQARLPLRTFAHRDPAALARVLGRLPRAARPLVLTDGLFGHDGSVAPVREYLAQLPTHAWLLVDDAHGAGVLGPHGRGTPEHARVRDPRVVQTITLSKAFGVYGGAILGAAEWRDRVYGGSRAFIGSTPLPLPLAHAALASVQLLQAAPERRHRLHANIARVKASLAPDRWPSALTPGPLLQCIPATPDAGRALARALERAGILPPWIRYPGGPPEGYFRFALSSEHTPGQLDRLAGVLQQI